jgi:NAD(P)-dependent dehydrogenase (short-subunit alcohol dehydrogenase family)
MTLEGKVVAVTGGTRGLVWGIPWRFSARELIWR